MPVGKTPLFNKVEGYSTMASITHTDLDHRPKWRHFAERIDMYERPCWKQYLEPYDPENTAPSCKGKRMYFGDTTDVTVDFKMGIGGVGPYWDDCELRIVDKNSGFTGRLVPKTKTDTYGWCIGGY